MDTSSVQQAIDRMLAANNEQQRQVLVSEQHALLSPTCDVLLGECAVRARSQGDRERLHSVGALRALLFEARILGIDRAWNIYAGILAREQAASAKAEQRRKEEEERRKRSAYPAAEEAKRLAEERRADDELWKNLGISTPDPNDHPWQRMRTIYLLAPQIDQSQQMTWYATQTSGASRRPNPGRYDTEVALLWLRQPSYRDQRRVLEHHLELLSDRSIVDLRQITIGLQRGLEDLTVWFDGASPDYPTLLADVQEHEELLLECRGRGGTLKAIQDAYVNRHGGFTLDGPVWLEELTSDLDRDPAAGVVGPIAERIVRLRTALNLSKSDPTLPGPTLAELNCELAGSLARLPEQADSTRAEQIQLLEQATGIYTREIYPLQWLRTQVALVATQPAASQIARATRADGPLPNTASDWVLRGEWNAQSGAWLDAAACFLRATQLEPELSGAWSGLADSYIRLGFICRALVAGARTMELQPGNAATWELLATLYLDHDRYVEALASYDRSLQLDGAPIERWHGKGETLFGLSRFQDAVAVYDLILVRDPDNFVAWNNKGNNLLKMGKYADAVSAFDRAIALKPDSWPTWHIRGEALDSLEKHQAALDSFDQSLRFNPQVPQSWHNRGTDLLKLDRRDEALLSFETAVELAPTFVPAWHALRSVYLDLGREDEEADAADRMARAL